VTVRRVNVPRRNYSPPAALMLLPAPQRVEVNIDANLKSPTTMLLAKLLLLPVAVASSVTLYVSSVPVSDNGAVIPSPIPLAQIEYDVDQSIGTLVSYTPPTGSYASDHLLRVGLSDAKTGSWRGIVTSAASFADHFHKKFVIHVDDKGEPYHVGFGTSAKGSGGDEVEVEIVKRNPGPKPVLNKPIVLNAEGKLDDKEPEKSFLQKYVMLIVSRAAVKLIVLQILVGTRTVPGGSIGFEQRRRQVGIARQFGIYTISTAFTSRPPVVYYGALILQQAYSRRMLKDAHGNHVSRW
jgi:hypothetical protein